MLQQTRVLFVSFSLLIILILFWGCDDNPLAPEEEQPKDYAVYAFDSTNYQYFEYHPLTGVLDSFTCDDSPVWGMEASADGKYLFLAAEDYLAKVDLITKSTVATLPYKVDCGIAVSPDNELIALSMGPGFVIARVSDLSIVYENASLDYRIVSFSTDGNRLYGCYDTSNTVAMIDIENSFSITTNELSVGPIRTLKPSIDETKLFLIWRNNKSSNAFTVYDVASDSITFREWLYGGYVDIKVDPDGRYVFYTEAGDYVSIPGSNYFTIYDINRKRIFKISTVGIDDGINPIYMAVYPMCLTPDNKWLVIGESPKGKSFLRFNITIMEIDDFIKGDSTAHLKYFTCQCN